MAHENVEHTEEIFTMKKRVLVLNGPNLNRLGKREVHIYGQTTLEDIEKDLIKKGEQQDCEVVCKQSNHEGDLIDWIHDAEDHFDAIVMNPGAFTHYSYAIRDAVASITKPCIEIHISNIHTREPFREKSVIAPVCMGQICGLGLKGYELALYAVLACIKEA